MAGATIMDLVLMPRAIIGTFSLTKADPDGINNIAVTVTGASLVAGVMDASNSETIRTMDTATTMAGLTTEVAISMEEQGAITTTTASKTKVVIGGIAGKFAQ